MLNIEQHLADRGMALTPKSLPSIKEIAEAKIKKTSPGKAKANADENSVSPKAEAKLPEVQKLTIEDAQRRALLLGLKDANSSNRAECIAYISKEQSRALISLTYRPYARRLDSRTICMRPENQN